MNTIRTLSGLATRHQRGLTLVEMMVALVLGLILAAGMIQLFIGTKQTYRFYDALSRIQENGRFALDSMANDIRMADQRPLNTPPLVNAVAPNGTSVNNNDDITVIWRLGNVIPPNQTRAYSIRPRFAGGVAPTCATAGTSLYLDFNDGRGAQELVEGVEAMQIRYGVCNVANGVINSPANYVAAAAVANWNLVCSVRIDLLMVSLEDRVVTQPQAIFFPPYTNNVWPVNDRCLRQAFSKTVAIRKRMP